MYIRLISYQIDIGIGQCSRVQYRYRTWSEKVASGHIWSPASKKINTQPVLADNFGMANQISREVLATPLDTPPPDTCSTGDQRLSAVNEVSHKHVSPCMDHLVGLFERKVLKDKSCFWMPLLIVLLMNILKGSYVTEREAVGGGAWHSAVCLYREESCQRGVCNLMIKQTWHNKFK